jgi:hypothetical protein
VRDNSRCFWSKMPWWKRKCGMVHCHDATVSYFVAKVWGEVFAHFYAVAVKHESSMRNWPFGLPGRILCEQSPWCQRKLWACSWLCLEPSMPCAAHVFFTERLWNHCQVLRCTFSKICTKLDAHSLFLRQIHHKVASGQICDSKQKDVRYQHVHLSVWNFVAWLALLHLLYRWQHQSQKL